MTRTTYNDQLRSIGASIGLALGASVIGNIVVAVTGFLLEAVGIPIFSRPARTLFLGTVLLQGVTFGGLALVYLRVRDLEWSFVRVHIPSLRDLGVALGGFLLLLVMLFTASTLLSALGIESAQNQIVEIGQQNPIVFLVLVPLSFLLVGPGEELLFRGLIQGTLMETFHPIRAVVLASGLFALIHLPSLSGEGKLVYVGIVFALALVLGGTYEFTDNLAVPSLIHGAYNAVQFGGAYLAATGTL